MKFNIPGLFKKGTAKESKPESKEDAKKGGKDIQIANTEMYKRRIDSNNPGCFFFLIDQSGSMADPFGGEQGRSKAERLADVINRLLSELVSACTKKATGDVTKDVRNRFDIGVIGYGQRVGPALSGPLSGRNLIPTSEIAANPARVEERRIKVEDGAGGLVEVKDNFSIWLDPVAQNGTPMCEALRQTHSIIEAWTQKHLESFPPIVINITDGEATDGDPQKPADELRKLATNYGKLLLFNLHLSSRQGASILYPESDSSLPDEYARQLFQMSSIIPFPMQKLAEESGCALRPQSRGFVFNADVVEVIKFLEIGTISLLR